MSTVHSFHSLTTDSWMEKFYAKTSAEGSVLLDRADATVSLLYPKDDVEREKGQQLSRITGISQILIGLLILRGNTVVLIVLQRIPTLAELTRFLLGNLAVADCIFGSTCFARGVLSMSSGVEVASYCPHVIGLLIMGLTYTLGITAVISGHTVYLVAKGATYDKEWANNVVNIATISVTLAAGGTYPLIFLFLEESDSNHCSATIGYVNILYLGVIFVLAIVYIIFSLVCQVLTGVIVRQKLRRLNLGQSYRFSSQCVCWSPNVDIDTTSTITKTVTIEMHCSSQATTTNMPGTSTTNTNLSISDPRTAMTSSDLKQESTLNSRPAETTNRKFRGYQGVILARIKREKHTFKIIATISVCLFICTTPSLIVQFINTSILSFHVHKDLQAGLTTFSLLNSLMNVIIFIMPDTSFRKSVADLFKCGLCQSNTIHPATS